MLSSACPFSTSRCFGQSTRQLWKNRTMLSQQGHYVDQIFPIILKCTGTFKLRELKQISSSLTTSYQQPTTKRLLEQAHPPLTNKEISRYFWIGELQFYSFFCQSVKFANHTWKVTVSVKIYLTELGYLKLLHLLNSIHNVGAQSYFVHFQNSSSNYFNHALMPGISGYVSSSISSPARFHLSINLTSPVPSVIA